MARRSVSRGANPGTDSEFPANCAGNLVSVPGLRRIAFHLPQKRLSTPAAAPPSIHKRRGDDDRASGEGPRGGTFAVDEPGPDRVHGGFHLEHGGGFEGRRSEEHTSELQS